MKLLPFILAATFLWALPLASAPAAEPPNSWTHEWKQTDFSRTSIKFDEIMSGGPPKDGIPAIDQPIHRAPEEINMQPRPNKSKQLLHICNCKLHF